MSKVRQNDERPDNIRRKKGWVSHSFIVYPISYNSGWNTYSHSFGIKEEG